MCSGIRLITKDDQVIVARTFEFGNTISNFKKFQNNKIKGVSTPDDKLLDGLNREGLHVMCFYFPKSASYSKPKHGVINVKPTDFAMMILEKCKSTNDVEYLIPKVNVIDEKYPPFTETPPMHWMVTDRQGKSVVLEPENGKLNVYKNEIGVFTNSPSFPEHLEEAKKSKDLPGDFSSISRFIRLAFFADVSPQPKNSAEGFNTAMHILNNFDIPPGATNETTLYTVFYNLSTKQVLIKENNQTIRNL